MRLLLIAVGAVAQLAAFYFGAWMMLGTAYGETGTAIAGFALILAPLLLAVGGAWLSASLRRRGAPGAGWATGIPLLLLLAFLAWSLALAVRG